MDKEKYLETRGKLLDEAQNLINENKLDEAAEKRKEIEKLDSDFQEASKEKANLKALESNNNAINLENNNVSEKGEIKLVDSIVQDKKINYEDVFAKFALKRELNKQEIEIFNEYNPENAYTHNTTNTEIVIPETVVAGIEEKMVELHPILADVRSTKIKGTVKYVKHTDIPAGDADYYDEATPTADEENTFGELVLGGKELSKAVTVTWKLQAMSVSEFVPFLKAELGRRMGYAKARAFIRGAGDTSYPEGVITSIDAEVDTPQKVEYDPATGIAYEDLTTAMSKIKSMYISGSKIYANNNTVWTLLANIKDANDRPIFVPDVTSGGVGRIFGLIVLEEDGLNDGEVLIGNMAEGYKENQQEPMRLVTEQHAKARNTDFVGYEVHDGGVYDNKAFAYITETVV
jgi:HK97 family phage major capsid protein